MAASYPFIFKSHTNAANGLSFYRVARQNLDITVKKDGELQAVNNTDIICEVEGATTITSIVKEGSTVHKGDIIVELDSSQLSQKIDDTTLEVQRAEVDLTTSREMLAIQKSQNDTNLESAAVASELADIAYEKYDKGDYPKLVADAQVAKRMAEIDLANKETDFKQVQALAAKGFLTDTDVKQREVDLLKARNALDSAITALTNLTTYEKQAQYSKLENDKVTAKARKIRTERENAANLAQKVADLSTKEQILQVQKRKLDKYREQFAACKIKAPEEGLVVYGTSGDRNAQNPIQEGATVRERQLILRLPDTAKMKAVVRIQEAQINRLKEGQKAMISIAGIPKPLTGQISKISVLVDNSQRWWNPDLKEYPVDVDLDDTPVGLKPGVSAQSEIYVARLDSVVAVPVSTIYSSGSKAYVFLKPEGDAPPRPREVKLGMANDTNIEIKDGLKEGEDLVILQAGQGRELLAKAGIADEPTTRANFGGRRRGGPGGPDGPTGTPPAGAAPSVPGQPAPAVPAAPAEGGGRVGADGRPRRGPGDPAAMQNGISTPATRPVSVLQGN